MSCAEERSRYRGHTPDVDVKGVRRWRPRRGHRGRVDVDGAVMPRVRPRNPRRRRPPDVASSTRWQSPGPAAAPSACLMTVGATYKAREVDAELRGARTLERRS